VTGSENELPYLALVDGLVRSGIAGEPTEAVLVGDSRVIKTGTTSDVLAHAPAGTRIVQLGGRSVMPAFTDSHTHFHRAAMLRRHFLDFDALAPRSISDVLDAVRRRVVERGDEVWIQGDNLSAAQLIEERLPTRGELDSVSAERPVILRTVGKHAICANSAALAAAAITRDTADPTGGRIERGDDGEPNGVLHETAKLRLDATRADTVVPPLDIEQRLAALKQGLDDLNRHGIAEIHEIVQSPSEMSDYLQLREKGELTARVVFYVRVVEGQATLRDLTAVGLRSGFGDDWLRLGGIKVSIDGSCTVHNAAVYDGYLDDPGNNGLIRIPQPELDDVVMESSRAGLQVAVHAIGPRAVDMALDSIARAQQAVPGSERLRHRIEHAYLAPRPGQLERMRELQVVVSTQPAFLWANGDTWPVMFGAAESSRMMPMRTLLDLGIPTQMNSDFPNAPLDPLVTIRAACDRTTRSGSVMGEQEAISPEEAWSLASVASAYSAFEDGSRSALVPGQLADLIVLSGDPYDHADLNKLSIEMTVVGGRVVYTADEFAAS
jgi:predicted amidohydrolase YtcJ